jgi:hypothetical protein
VSLNLERRSLFSVATSQGSWWPAGEWEFAAFAALFAMASDILNWAYKPKFGWWLLPYFLITLTVASAAIYIGATEKSGTRTSTGGFLRFVVSGMLLLLPFGTALGALAYVVQTDASPNIYAVLAWIFGLIMATVVVMLLPAWPFAQSLKANFVSPFRVLAATRGHRWSLIGLGFLLGGLSNNDLVPSATKAANIWEATSIGLVDALVTVVSLSLSASVAAAAWQFAAANDPQLA